MRIAIVNDLPLAVEGMRKALVDSGRHEVIWTARDGAQAVELCSVDRPDVIVMDLLMPGMDGVEATRRIMEKSPCAILIATATVEGNSTKVFEAMGAGALDVVETPGLALGATTVDRPPIPHATMLARAEWLRRYPYDATLARAEDRDLWCRAAGTSRIDVIGEVLYVVYASAKRPTFIEDYLVGQADLRRVLLRYGWRSPVRTARAALASTVKSGLMVAADRVGR